MGVERLNFVYGVYVWKKINVYILTFQQTGFDTFLHISGSLASAHLGLFFYFVVGVWVRKLEFPDFSNTTLTYFLKESKKRLNRFVNYVIDIRQFKVAKIIILERVVESSPHISLSIYFDRVLVI